MMIFHRFTLDGSRQQWMSELPGKPAGLKVLLWGCKDFIEKVKEMLGGRACGRRVHEVSKFG